MLVVPQPSATDKPIAGYEIHFDYAAVPVRFLPLTADQLPDNDEPYTLLSVNEEEYNLNPCRRFVTRTRGRFQLGTNGRQLLDLLTFQPQR